MSYAVRDDGAGWRAVNRADEVGPGEYYAEAPPSESLDVTRRRALDDIDAAAGTARAKYFTVCSGQDATYLLKAADADLYKAAGYPAAQIASYPWVRAKAASMVATPAAADYQAAADLIVATRNTLVTIGANIEQAREIGKRQVNEATTTVAVEAAKASAVAALAAL